VLDANSIYERDCVAGMEEIAAGSVDLAFADPPFNIGYDYDVYDDAKDADHYLDWSRRWIEGIFHVLKPTGTFWLAIGDEYAAELKLITQKIGFTCRSWVIWYYTFGVNCKQKFNRSHAHLFHFVKDPKKFTFNFNDKLVRVPSARQLVYADGRANPEGRLPDDTWILRPQDLPDGFAEDEDTWYFPRVAGTFKERAGFHGCQMPEQLLGRIIRCCSDPGDLVLDPFSGSATTLVVAKKLGRQWIGFDLSAAYVRRGRARLGAATVGAPLHGAPQPLVSAPATPIAVQHTSGAAGQSGHLQGCRSLRSRRATESREKGNSATLPSNRASSSADIERALLEAFRLSSQGFSLDRVLADDALNAAFADRCCEFGLPGAPEDWNRALFRMRKAGKMSRIPTGRRTEFDWHAADHFLFASEIALHEMQARGNSLDDILCNTQLKRDFDQIARSFAPDFHSFDYRWGALKIRKLATEGAWKKADSIVKSRMPGAVETSRFPTSKWSRIPGNYLVCSEETVRAGRILYAGFTLDLGHRLSAMLDANGVRDAWKPHADSGRLFLRIFEMNGSAGRSWINELAPHQLRMINDFRPILNFRHEHPNRRAGKRLAG
jgi:site-specific DNA-methyltransferase (adenine-specific)